MNHLAVLENEIGNGETDCNNGGPAVARYHMEKYIPGHSYGPWCACLQSYCLINSGTIPKDKFSYKQRKNAKALVQRVGELYSFVVEPQESCTAVCDQPLQRGDLICWHRGQSSNLGHIACVLDYDQESDDLTVIDGNGENYPSLVRKRLINAGKWRRKLYAVARIV